MRKTNTSRKLVRQLNTERKSGNPISVKLPEQIAKIVGEHHKSSTKFEITFANINMSYDGELLYMGIDSGSGMFGYDKFYRTFNKEESDMILKLFADKQKLTIE